MTIRLFGALLYGAPLIVLATATTAVAQSRQITTPKQTQRGYYIPGSDTFRDAQGLDEKTKKTNCVVKSVKEAGKPVIYVKVCS